MTKWRSSPEKRSRFFCSVMKGTFVFVVCGTEEHIDTLHFSLNYLKRFSKNQIIVLTDSSRNSRSIVHDNILDVQTPSHFTHHQASIYLKVGIHRYLPTGIQYCYLDTDVVALSEDVDYIFDEFVEPIRFASDQFPIHQFSSRALNCGCLERKRDGRQQLEYAWRYSHIDDPLQLQKKAELKKLFRQLDSNWLLKKVTNWRYSLAGNKFRLNRKFWFDKADRVWYDGQDEPVLFEDVYDWIGRKTGLTQKGDENVWLDSSGINIWLDDCHHLVEQIRSKFNIEVIDREWQHWNGGVFLFNDKSHGFLESWFEKTMQIFEDPDWKVRDQGTLIANVWQFGLQDSETLDQKWNFLADYENPNMKLSEETGEFTNDDFHTSLKPAFVHVYHHFGDTSWKLWNWIVRR